MTETKQDASFTRILRKTLRPFRLVLAHFAFDARNSFLRIMRPPVIPKNSDGRVLIHLGCGEKNDPHYINVDAVAYPHVHYVSKVNALPMFKENEADLIYACHVLEHIPYPEMEAVLSDWYRVLKPGGVLRISVPEFEKIIVIYRAEGMEKALPPLMGAEDTEHGYHRTAFSEEYLGKLLKRVGFRETHRWDPGTAPDYTFDDWAKKLVHGVYPVSLNMEGAK